MGSNPGAGSLLTLRLSHRHHGGIFVFVFFVFLCFDFVPFVGDHRECRGDVAFPPTCGPSRRQGLGSQF